MNKTLTWFAFIFSLLALGAAVTLLILGNTDESATNQPTGTTQNTVSQNTTSNAANTVPSEETSEIVAEESGSTSVATTDYCDAALGFGFDFPSALGEPAVSSNALADSAITWGTNPDNLLPSNATGASTFSVSVNQQGGIGLEPYDDVDRHEVSTDLLSGNWALLEWGDGFGEVPELNFLLMVNVTDGTHEYQIMAQYDERPTVEQEAMVNDMLESWTNTCVE